MKNVKFLGIPRQKDEFRGSIPRQKPKFRGSARNSAGHGKLWALIPIHQNHRQGLVKGIQILYSNHLASTLCPSPPLVCLNGRYAI